ncbi:Transposase IS4 [Popillia japonica]|uniref:Transposase IS4 n=1 Tax=Popillia japonica TaxID=7064 RepID=A0AAW1JHD4_POPJA
MKPWCRITAVMGVSNTSTDLELAPHEQDHSVDEAMVPYYGRHGCKQYIHGKPIRYGYKLWTGTTRLGLWRWSNSSSQLRQCLTRTVAAFHLYFDNYFTSVPLLEELSKRKLFGTGTVRENRLPGKPLLDNKVMKKQNRGYFDYQKIKGSNIIALKWNDNNIVCCLSNEAGVNPIHSTKRYSRKDKKIVQISQPHVISLYNRNMGGVDRSDENIAKYRISIRGKKWYFSLVSHCIDLAINNAWLLHRLWGGEHDLLKFRRSIAITMLSQHKKRKDYNRSHASATGIQNDALRYDAIEHYVIPQEKQTRCAECHTKTTTRCRKCDIGLHVK